jgi:photosystem II stability/assembly factor-like uncharacterized protein
MTKDQHPEAMEEVIYSFAAPPGYDLAENSGLPCYAASSTGLLISLDIGRTWQSGYDSLELENPLPTPAVAVSPNFKSDRTVVAGIPGGVLRSIDSGQNWELKAFSTPPPLVSALVISPDYVEDGILLAGTTEDGIYRSSDHGFHWSAWNFGLLDLNVLCMAISPDFSKDETVFLGVDSGIFLSKNGGRAWKEVNLPVGFDPTLSLEPSPNFAQDGTLYAGTETKGLLVSTDRGKIWDQVGTRTFTEPINAIILAPDFPQDPHLLILLENTILASYDGGQSWQNWREDQLSDLIVTSIFAPKGFREGTHVLIGTLGGRILRID